MFPVPSLNKIERQVLLVSPFVNTSANDLPDHVKERTTN